MRPISLELIDFTNHANTFIDFEKLDKASIIIGKENGSIKMSNGVGKTNIFNAIKVALFDSKIFPNKDKIIRDGTNKCGVKFAFELSTGTFRVERYRTKTTQGVKLFQLTDQWNDISDRTTTLTNKKIIDIIGINEHTFENAHYLKQNNYTKRKVEAFAAATPEERKSIIIDLLDLGGWNKYEEKAKDLRKTKILSLQNCKNDISEIGDPSKQIEYFDNELIETQNTIITNKQIIEKLSPKLDALKALSIEKNNELKQNADLPNKLNAKNVQLNSAITKYKNLLTQKQTKDNSIVDLKKRLNAETNKLILLSQKTFPAIDKNQYDAWMLELASLRRKKMDYEAESKSLNNPLPKDDFCPTCGKDLDDCYKIETTNKRNCRKAEIANEITAINTRAAELTKLRQDYEATASEIENNTKQQNLLNSSVSCIQNQLNNALAFSYDEDIANAANIIVEFENETKLLKEEVGTYNVATIKNEIVANNAAIVATKASLDAATNAINNSSKRQGQVEISLKNANESLIELEELKKNEKDLEKEVAVYKAVVSCFSSSGIPAMIVHTALDALQYETNNILELLKPILQVKFVVGKEQGDALDIVYYKNGVEHDFENLSGGEQSTVVIAFKLAIAEIARKRCGSKIKLLLLDEADAPIDPTTVESFYKTIKHISKEMTVLVISHNPELKSLFNSVIMVTKTNDISKGEACKS